MELIDNVMINIGAFFMVAGGITLMAAVVGFAAYLVASLWVLASNKWRLICRAESIIHEYRRNRRQFLKWRDEQNDQH